MIKWKDPLEEDCSCWTLKDERNTCLNIFGEFQRSMQRGNV